MELDPQKKESNSTRLAVPFIILLASLGGTFFVWKYLPEEQLRLYILLSGLIVDFLLFGVLYLFSSSSELKSLLRSLASAKALVDEERARYAALLAGIGDGVVAVGRDGKIIFMNQVAGSLLGWDPKEAAGSMWFEVLKRVDDHGRRITPETGAINVALSMSRKVTTTTSHYYLRKDGAKFPVAITVSPVLLNGEIIGAVDVFRDITKEKQIDKTKTEFVSLASHQLRTPLSIMNWYAEMLLSGDAGKITKEQKSFLDEIYHASRRMAELVNALLNVSRIELGTFAVEPEPTNIRDIADSVWGELKLQIRSKKLEIAKHYDKKIPILNVDPRLVRIIFQNLFSNAVKYTPAGGRIEATIIKEKGEILIKVADTGYGIPRSEYSRIFEKLFRATNVREKDTEGTGLGLYIVKAIAENSGGKIWFESQENKGTTFYVTIPPSGMKKKEGTKGLSSDVY